MNPELCLLVARSALDAGDLATARDRLDSYTSWRLNGGYEPAMADDSGDRYADRLRAAFWASGDEDDNDAEDAAVDAALAEARIAEAKDVALADAMRGEPPQAPRSCLDPDLGDLAMHLLDASDALRGALEAALFLCGGDRQGRGGWPAMIALANRLDALVSEVVLMPGPEIFTAIQDEHARQCEEDRS